MQSDMTYRICSLLLLLFIMGGCMAAGEKNPVSGEENGRIRGLSTVSGDISVKTLYGSSTGKTLRVLPAYAKDRVIVRYRTDGQSPGTSLPPKMNAMNRKMGATVVRDFSDRGVPGMQIIRTPNMTVDEAVQTLSNDSGILYAEPDHLICLSPDEEPDNITETTEGVSSLVTGITPDDPDFSLLWGLYNTGQLPFSGTSGSDIDAPGAWTVSTGSSSVVIAVVDTGIDYTHPDLSDNIWTNPAEIGGNNIDDDGNGYVDDVRGWNFADDSNDPADDNGHGTHCAGTIAAVGNNNLGVTGVCWKARLMPLKFLDANGSGYTSDAISAILYANKMGADIISNSWGSTGYSRGLKEAIDASPSVVVCAAGNNADDSDSSPFYPAAYPSSQILSVAATDYNDKLASFSNYGVSSVDIAAPGVQIKSCFPGSQYQYLSGTSMATPHVSGVAGLLKAAEPSRTAVEIRDQILSSVDQIPSLIGKLASGGRLNAAKTLGITSGEKNSTSSLSTRQNSGVAASFLAAPVRGTGPLTVQFLDSSSGGPVSWRWDFGDGNISDTKSPRHTYLKAGRYSVSLTVTGLKGADSMTKVGYIIVS